MIKNKFFDILTENNLKRKYYLDIYDSLKKEILKTIYLFYKDLLEKEGFIRDIKTETIYNAKQDIFYNAVEKNELIYKGGYFDGKPSKELKEEIKRLNGNFVVSLGAYYIPIIPFAVKQLIEYKSQAKDRVIQSLFFASPVIKDYLLKKVDKMKFEKTYQNLHDELLNKMNFQVDKTHTTDSETFIDKYTNSTKFEIKGFLQEEIDKLRDSVINAVKEGKNETQLQSILGKKYNLNIKRAKRIAKQEYNLALKQYQYDFMESTGNDLFYWVHTHRNDPNSRPEHINFAKESDMGKIYSYKNLPINPKTMKPDAPGILWNCYCLARFIIVKK